jgi:hypothetical protein
MTLGGGKENIFQGERRREGIVLWEEGNKGIEGMKGRAGNGEVFIFSLGNPKSVFVRYCIIKVYTKNKMKRSLHC